jgi:hypothetical protein
MSIETKERTIDGRKVMVTQFPARKGLQYLTRLTKLVGPALGSLAKGFSPTAGIDSTLAKISIDVAITALVERLDENETVDLVLLLLAFTRLDGKEIGEEMFDIEFAGNYLLMSKILGFVLEVNYASFFGEGGIGGLSARAASLMSAASSTASGRKSNKSGESGA